MKRTKRLISTLLALCMVLAMLPANAMAAGSGDYKLPNPDSNGVITLTSDIPDITKTQSIPNTVKTLDLNGHSITGNVTGGPLIQVGANVELVIKDSTAKGAPTVNDDYSVTLTNYTSGKIENTLTSRNKQSAIMVSDGGKLTVESGKIICASNVGISANPTTTKVTNSEPLLTINGGYVEAQEAGILVAQGGNVEINGGVVYSKDNAAVSGNGKENIQDAPTKITVNNGQLIGQITSNGYVACGIYHPQSGTLDVKGGTIVGVNGAGIVARAGTINLTGGTVIGTGDGSRKGGVGDKATEIKSGTGIIYDLSANYPGASKGTAKATISGTATVKGTVNVNAATDKDNTATLEVSGGTFSSANAVAPKYLSSAVKYQVSNAGNTSFSYYTKAEDIKDLPSDANVSTVTPGTGSNAPTVAPVTKHTVTFMVEGTQVEQLYATNGGTVLGEWPANPTKANYTFDGWYANKVKYTKDSTFTANTTLTAQFKYSGATIGGDGRFTVLVLDESGSMYGTPSRNLKDAAKKFCAAVSSDKGGIENHLAIVGFSTGATVLHSFNDDPALINSKIDQLYADGLTNIGDALQTAKGLLDQYATGKDVIKNIVLLSDGLPETNSKLPTGKYSSVDYPDYYFYGSANYCYKMAEDAKLVGENRDASYNVYTLGFFHSMSAKRAEFCKKVLRDLQSAPDGSQFYQITDVDQVQFVLSDYVLNDILKDDEIDSGTPAPTVADDRIVITIACPVDVKVMHNGKTILDSAPDANILKCDYGVMDVTPGENGTTKIVTLHAGYRYNLKLTATGEGKVDVSWARYAAGSSEPAASGSQSFPAVKVGDYIPVAVSKGNDAEAPAVTVPETPVTSAPVKDEDIADSDAESHFAFVPAFDGGVVVLSRYDAKFGDWVNVYVTPDDGYELESLSITDQRGWPVVLREMGENVFSFTMPNARITVNAAFAKVEDDDPYSTVVPDTIPNVEGSSPNYGSMVINPAAMNYPDVNAGDWFYNNVKFCHERYLLNKTGEAEGKFEPNTAATRATVWTALSRLAGRNTMNQGDNWYDRAQVWAKNKGISDGERPLDSLTREEFVTMLWRYDGNKYVQNSALSQFSDGSSVSWWATEAVKWAVANGLLNGANGSLNPQSNVTRAEVAAILQRYIQNVH